SPDARRSRRLALRRPQLFFNRSEKGLFRKRPPSGAGSLERSAAGAPRPLPAASRLGRRSARRGSPPAPPPLGPPRAAASSAGAPAGRATLPRLALSEIRRRSRSTDRTRTLSLSPTLTAACGSLTN